MKKVISIILAAIMVFAFPVTAFSEVEDTWTLYSDAYINGVKVDPKNTVKLVKGEKLFICFDTDARNADHGYAPLVGFADNYPGGMLSSKGFKVTGGNASSFGYDYKDWGFGSDPFGALIEAGDLKAGTVGKLDYFLYKDDSFTWEKFNTTDYFTDHESDKTEIKTLTFVVTEGKKENTLSVKAKKTTVKYAKLKKKKQVVLRKKVLSVKNAKGKVTYAKVKAAKGISVNKKNGKITLKKGLNKGTYSVKVKVTAVGNSKYEKGSKTVTVIIKVN